MLALIALLALAQEPANEPTPAQVAEVESALEQAYRSGDTKRIQGALEAAQGVPHASVVDLIARGLASTTREVQLAALQSLRWNEHEKALDVLHTAHKDRRWQADAELAFTSLRAIGQHADARSIRVLARDPFEPRDHACWRARLFGLARIRTRASLEALFTILGATTGGHGERSVAPVMADARVALILVTGVDQGLSPELWERWWRDHKKGFQPPAEVPLLPKELRRDWDAFWGLPQDYERSPRREDRGRSPERPRAP